MPRYSGDCQHCGTQRHGLHRDHIIPLFKGGSDHELNIQWLCANCHENKTLEDFRGYKHTEEGRARISAGVRAYYARASLAGRARLAESVRKAYQRPEVRARHSERVKEAMRSPETRAKISERVKQALQPPEVRARISAGVKRANARRRAVEQSATT